MSEYQIVDASQVEDWVNELLEQKVWLVEAPTYRHCDRELEREAILFLLSVGEQGVSSWGDTRQEVKEQIHIMVVDFLAKLMHPQTPFSGQWEVTTSDSVLSKVVWIMTGEIRKSDARFTPKNWLEEV